MGSETGMVLYLQLNYLVIVKVTILILHIIYDQILQNQYKSHIRQNQTNTTSR